MPSLNSKGADLMKKSGKVWVAVVVALFIIIALLLGAVFYVYKLATDTSEASKLETTASTTSSASLAATMFFHDALLS